MKSVFTSLLLLIVFSFARAQSPDQKHPFAVELSIEAASMHTEIFRRNGGFLVDAKITNISGEDQMITLWTQRGWSWLSDSPVLTPDTSAMQNVPSMRVLKSSDVYSERVWVYFYPRRQGSVTFRLGFFPRAKFPVSDRPNEIPRDQVSWSNPVTLTP